MSASGPVPCFIFAYVARRPRSAEEGIKLPVVRRQLSTIKARARASALTLGRHFIVATTYRKKAFIDHPVFDEAVSFAQKNGMTLLVGDLAELLSGVPAGQFRRCSDKLDSLDVNIWDAFTGRLWQDIDDRTKDTIYGMAVDRYRRGAKIAAGRKKVQSSAGNIAGNQARGATANRVRAKRLAERIRPVVDEMKAALPASEPLSPSALMHRLNELGVRGPRSKTWSLNAAKRCLKILADGIVAAKN